MNKDFIDLLISNGEKIPPQTQEQKLQDSINTLTHRMEANFNSMQKEIDSIKTKSLMQFKKRVKNINEGEVIRNEENSDSESKEGNGQEKPIQNDTVADNDND